MITNHHFDGLATLGFKVDKEWFSIKMSLDVYKGLLSTEPVKLITGSFKEGRDDIEHNEVSFFESDLKSSLFIKPFSFLASGFTFKYVLKSYNFIFPHYISSTGKDSEEQVKEFSLSPKIILKMPVGTLTNSLNFDEKSESLEGMILRNFRFSDGFFLSYSFDYQSRKLLKDYLIVGAGFSYDKVLREVEFYDHVSFKWLSNINLYLVNFFTLYLNFEKNSVSHLFDHENAYSFKVKPSFEWGKTQKAFIFFNYIKSDFGKYQEFSYETFSVGFSYKKIFEVKI